MIPTSLGARGRNAFDGAGNLYRSLVQRVTQITQTPTYRAARLSLITIHALLLREAITRYGQRSAGYAWAMIQPLIMLSAILLIFRGVGRTPAVGDSLVVFFMTGIIPVMMFRHTISRGANAIRSNRALMRYPQVTGLEVITARVLLELLTNFLVFLIIILFMKAFKGLPIAAWISNPLELLCALGTLALLCYGAAFLSAQIGRVVSQWSDFMGVLGRFLFFTSGVWFTLDTLPPRWRHYAGYNPVAQVIEWIRDAAIPGFESAHVNPGYPIAFAVVCLVLGLFVEWVFQMSGLDRERD